MNTPQPVERPIIWTLGFVLILATAGIVLMAFRHVSIPSELTNIAIMITGGLLGIFSPQKQTPPQNTITTEVSKTIPPP